MDRKKIISKFRKFHKWPGIVISIFAIHFAVSGIIMNHRSLFSGVDLSRIWLPKNYSYQNWNLAAVRGGLLQGKDTLLLYGNIGIWNSSLNGFTDFNQGFPQGIDHRKINQLVKYKNHFVTATQFGLFSRGVNEGIWRAIPLSDEGERMVDLFTKQDTLIALDRNYLYKSTDLTHFTKHILPSPEGYTKGAGMFITLWELHSGELFGVVGKLLVDILGIVTILLSVTGLIHFLLPGLIQRKRQRTGHAGKLPSALRKNLRWHNVVGYIFVFFLLINTTAGMFLRPPLLIPIINQQVGIIPGSHLDNPNAWHDKLRKGAWNEQLGVYLFSTSDGFYLSADPLKAPMTRCNYEPPISLMGCNVLEPVGPTQYLVGSFSGLYYWNLVSGEVTDYFTERPYQAPKGMAKPVSDHMIAGFLIDQRGEPQIFDYNTGLNNMPISPLSVMPEQIKEASPISLWNMALEIHTGRILERFIGIVYLLYIPIAGLCVITVLVSGFMVWWLAHRKKKKSTEKCPK